VLTPKKFARDLRKDKERLTVLFPDPTMRNRVSGVMESLTRISSAKQGTALLPVGAALAGGGWALYPLTYGDYGTAATRAGVTAGVVLSSRQLAKILTDQAGLRAMQALTTKSSPARVTEAWAKIATMAELENE